MRLILMFITALILFVLMACSVSRQIVSDNDSRIVDIEPTEETVSIVSKICDTIIAVFSAIFGFIAVNEDIDHDNDNADVGVMAVSAFT